MSAESVTLTRETVVFPDSPPSRRHLVVENNVTGDCRWENQVLWGFCPFTSYSLHSILRAPASRAPLSLEHPSSSLPLDLSPCGSLCLNLSPDGCVARVRPPRHWNTNSYRQPYLIPHQTQPPSRLQPPSSFYFVLFLWLLNFLHSLSPYLKWFMASAQLLPH